MVQAIGSPGGAHDLLVAFCCHIVACRHVWQLAEEHRASPDFNIDVYDQVLRMHERETRAAAALLTRTRLSQQQRFSAMKTSREP
jgi:hypothetical protein